VTNAEILLTGAMLLSIWLVLGFSWPLRNWRAVIFVSFATTVILTASLFGRPITIWVQTGIWVAVMIVLLIRNDWISVVSRSEYQFVTEYLHILRRVSQIKRRALERDSTESVKEYERIIDALDSLNAPAEWVVVKQQTVRELRRRLNIIKLLTTDPHASTVRYGDDRWQEIQDAYRRMFRRQTGFWRGWPHLRLR
jgi:hypothetical protein